MDFKKLKLTVLKAQPPRVLATIQEDDQAEEKIKLAIMKENILKVSVNLQKDFDRVSILKNKVDNINYNLLKFKYEIKKQQIECIRYDAKQIFNTIQYLRSNSSYTDIYK